MNFSPCDVLLTILLEVNALADESEFRNMASVIELTILFANILLFEEPDPNSIPLPLLDIVLLNI
jgi:hypothetical protein